MIVCRRHLAAVVARGGLALAVCGCAILALSGCASSGPVAGNVSVAGGGPVAAPSDASQLDSVTATRAGYVLMMLGNVMGTQALDGGALNDVVLGYGGGYVLSVSAASQPYSEHEMHVVDVALGVTNVIDHMQGEAYFGPAAALCYRYRIGYHYYLVSYASISCAAVGAPVNQQGAGLTWEQAMTAAESLFDNNVPRGTVPASLAQAEALLGHLPRRASATAPAVPAGKLTPSDFATGTDLAGGSEYGTRTAALAVPLTTGICAYVSFGYTIESSGTRDLVSRGWAAPWHATCYGQAARAASIPFSADPHAGG
jgi:hypothetical protein